MTIYDIELMDQSMYSAAMAGRLTGLHPTRVRRWIQGYHYKYIQRDNGQPVEKSIGPVLYRGGRNGSSVSFLELIDLLFVKRLIDAGFSLQKIRKIFDEACRRIGGAHFLRKCFRTDGKKVYLKDPGNDDCLYVTLDSGGQLALTSILEPTSEAIDFDHETHLARKWYPTMDKMIVLNPMVAFGAPTVEGRSLKTASVYDFYLAEQKSLSAVCDWHELHREEAESAISFEESLLAA
jgi:uncharacterized protein (DUF433 family)